MLLVAEPGPDGTPVERVLVDPMAVDPSGATTLDAWQPSQDGDLLAYQVSEGGSEESVLRVIDVATGEVVDGPIDRARYSPVAWLRGWRGLLLRPPAGPRAPPGRRAAVPPPGLVPPARHRPRRGRRGVRRRSRDTTYYGARSRATAAGSSSPRRRAPTPATTSGSPTCRSPSPRPRCSSRSWSASTPAPARRSAATAGSTWAPTSTPRAGRLCVADPTTPTPEHWTDLVPQRDDAVLEDYGVLDGEALAAPTGCSCPGPSTRSRASRSTTSATAPSGPRCSCPGSAASAAWSRVPRAATRRGSPTPTTPACRTCTATTAPTGEVSLFASPPGVVEVPDVRTQQVEYTSADGTVVRMFVSRAPTPSTPTAVRSPPRPPSCTATAASASR